MAGPDSPPVTPASAGALAAFVQGVGFIITGIVPYVTGWLRDVSGSFQASWLLLSITVVMMLLVTWRFAPGGYAQAMGTVDPSAHRVAASGATL